MIDKIFAAELDLGEGIVGAGKYMEGAKNAESLSSEFISNMIGAITVVGGLAFLVFFLTGAIKWITAGGDKAKVQEAQAHMSNGLIGLVVLVVGYFAIGLIGGLLGIDILNPLKTLFINSK